MAKDVRPIGLGIVGYGNFGEFTTSIYAGIAGVRIAAVVERNEARRAAAAKQFQARAYDHVAKLVQDQAVDIVVVNTPPWLHGEEALTALTAGKHVFVEKPMATSLAAADRLIEAAAQGKLHVSVDYVMRHVPLYNKLRALAQSGLFGGITHVSLENNASAEALNADHWFWDRAKSGGILVEHGVHFFDLANQLAGATAANVAGYAHTAPDGRQDRVMAAVRYDNGVLASFYHAFDRRAVIERTVLHVTFERGSVAAYGWIPEQLQVEGTVDEAQLPALTALLETTVSTRLEPAPPGVPGGTPGMVAHATLTRPDRSADYAAAVKAGMADLVQAVRTPGFTPQVTAADGRTSLRIALAAQASIESGRMEQLG